MQAKEAKRAANRAKWKSPMHNPKPDEEPPVVQPERLGFTPDPATVVDGDFMSWFEPKAKPLTPGELLDQYGIERMCEDTMNGDSLSKMAQGIGVSIGALAKWLAKTPDRTHAMNEARRLSARVHDENALQVIRGATNFLELGKAREEASHLRWRASKTAPKEYGDRQHIELDAKVTMTPEQQLAKLDALTSQVRKLTGTT